MNPMYTVLNKAGSMYNGKLLKPYTGFRFMVEIEGILAGGFQEVSGLSVEIDVEDYKEGGVNGYTHRLPKRVKHGDIVLKRGLLDINAVGAWFRSIANGKQVQRRSGSIRVVNSHGVPTYSWDFLDAYPIKWEASGLNAGSSGIITETITLTHNGLKKFDLGVESSLNSAINKAVSIVGGLFK